MIGLGLGLGLSRSMGGVTYDYYVDSVNGSDANDGRTPGTAFETLAKLQTVLVEGSRARISGTFRERLTLPANNIVIDGGARDETLIDCSDAVPSEYWTKTAGRTNVYQADLDVQTDVEAAEYPSIWCDDVRLVYAATLDELDTTPGAYYHTSVTDITPITLYIHAPGSSNPISDGKVYDASIRARGIDSYSVTGAHIKNMRARRNYASAGSITLGRNCAATNVRCSEGNTHNIYYRANCVLTDVLCDEAYHPSQSPTLFIGYEGTAPTPCTATLTRCETTLSVYVPNCIGFYSHTGGSTNFDSITYNDCESLRCGVGFAAANLDLLVINGGDVTNYSQAVQTAALTTNITSTTFGAGAAGGIVLITGASGITINMAGVNANPATTGNIRSVHSSTTINISDCNLSGFNTFLLGSAADQTWTISNTTFEPDGRGYTIYQFTGSGLTYTSDNNDFGGNTTGDFVIGGTTYTDFTAYQAATGQDANSVN